MHDFLSKELLKKNDLLNAKEKLNKLQAHNEDSRIIYKMKLESIFY